MMINKKLIIVLILTFDISSISYAREIKNKHLLREYNIELKNKSKKLLEDNVSIEDCIRDCFDCSETNEFLIYEVYSIYDCFKYGDCVDCVDHCLETYDLSDDVEIHAIFYTRNKCFIGGL